MPRRVRLGESALEVVPLGAGCWAWGDRRYWRYEEDHGPRDVVAAFSAAIAAGLARGLGVHDALAEAKAFIAGAIRHALAVGHGHGPVNPMWRVVP